MNNGPALVKLPVSAIESYERKNAEIIKPSCSEKACDACVIEQLMKKCKGCDANQLHKKCQYPV